jgi:hypothetical protein
MTIQRYCALPTLSDARTVLFITLPAFLLLSSMCCFIGLIALAYFYNCNPLETGEISSQDQLVLLFAIRVLCKWFRFHILYFQLTKIRQELHQYHTLMDEE